MNKEITKKENEIIQINRENDELKAKLEEVNKTKSQSFSSNNNNNSVYINIYYYYKNRKNYLN